MERPTVVATDPLAALDFTPSVDCETQTLIPRIFRRPKLIPCPANAVLLVRVRHMPVAGVTADGQRVNGCQSAQTVVCLEHAQDFYADTLEELAGFLGWVGKCPGCGAEIDDDDDVYELERL